MLGADVGSRHRARRGLAIFFAVLVPVSAIFEVLIITTGNFSWLVPLVWVPALASVVARLVLREGFSDVSFRLGGRRGWSAIVVALLFPDRRRAHRLRHRMDDYPGTIRPAIRYRR